MDWAKSRSLMALTMRGNFLTMRSTGSGCISGPMDESTKGIGKIIEWMGMALSSGPMERNFRESSKMIKNTEKGYSSGLMAGSTLGNGPMVSKMGLEFINMLQENKK